MCYNIRVANIYTVYSFIKYDSLKQDFFLKVDLLFNILKHPIFSAISDRFWSDT